MARQSYAVDTLIEELNERCMSPLDLVERGDIQPIELGALLVGEIRMTPELAAGLERALGVSAAMWLNLDAAERAA